jgi:hypothetical protein
MNEILLFFIGGIFNVDARATRSILGTILETIKKKNQEC